VGGWRGLCGQAGSHPYNRHSPAHLADTAAAAAAAAVIAVIAVAWHVSQGLAKQAPPARDFKAAILAKAQQTGTGRAHGTHTSSTAGTAAESCSAAYPAISSPCSYCSQTPQHPIIIPPSASPPPKPPVPFITSVHRQARPHCRGEGLNQQGLHPAWLVTMYAGTLLAPAP
jgi:hypothetical protein